MKIITKHIDELEPAAYNPRRNLRPGDAAYERLKKSILEFDYVDPLVWNERTGHVIGGHQRLRILKDLGREKIKVSVVDLSEEKEKALNLALNKIQGEWDIPRLEDLLAEIETFNFDDVEITGFSTDEIEEILRGHSDRKEGLTDPDDVPEPPEEPVTKPGDIWLLGEHRIMCGDATNKSDIKCLLNGTIASMVFADPPYNVDYGSSKNPRHKIRKINNDKQSKNEWEAFCQAIAEICIEYNNGDIYVWGASGPDGMRQRLIFCDAGIHWSATIIWKKQQLVLSPANYQRIYEACFYGWPRKSSFVSDRKQVEVWEIDRPLYSDLHPTTKPVELCERGINNSSRQGDVVLDPFVGSGSTIIACENQGRRCFAMEINPHYCDVAVKRWEEFSGRKAGIMTENIPIRSKLQKQ